MYSKNVYSPCVSDCHVSSWSVSLLLFVFSPPPTPCFFLLLIFLWVLSTHTFEMDIVCACMCACVCACMLVYVYTRMYESSSVNGPKWLMEVLSALNVRLFSSFPFFFIEVDLFWFAGLNKVVTAHSDEYFQCHAMYLFFIYFMWTFIDWLTDWPSWLTDWLINWYPL